MDLTKLSNEELMLNYFDDHSEYVKEIAHRLVQAEKQNVRMKELLEDFALNGVRHDLNPTLCFDASGYKEYSDKLIGFFYGYIKSIDDAVRSRAKNALSIEKSLEKLVYENLK